MSTVQIIKNLVEGTNAFYVLELSSDCPLDLFSYEMILQNDIKGLVKPRLLQLNDQQQLRYDLNEYLTLSTLMQQRISWENLVNIIKSITETMLALEEYMLDHYKIYLDPEYLFICRDTLSVQLIYLPVMIQEEQSYTVLGLTKYLLNTAVFSNVGSSTGFAKLMSYLNEGVNHSLKEFHHFLTHMHSNSSKAILTRVVSNEEVSINKEKFVIGSNPQMADFIVFDNKKVSRQHAFIEQKEGQYFLTDNNSLNKTYLNGELLLPQVAYALPLQCEIRCANEVFYFKLTT